MDLFHNMFLSSTSTISLFMCVRIEVILFCWRFSLCFVGMIQLDVPWLGAFSHTQQPSTLECQGSLWLKSSLRFEHPQR